MYSLQYPHQFCSFICRIMRTARAASCQSVTQHCIVTEHSSMAARARRMMQRLHESTNAHYGLWRVDSCTVCNAPYQRHEVTRLVYFHWTALKYSPNDVVSIVSYCKYMLNHSLEWVSDARTNLSHCRQWFNILNPCSDRIASTVVCFITHDCTSKLWKQYECELSVV